MTTKHSGLLLDPYLVYKAACFVLDILDIATFARRCYFLWGSVSVATESCENGATTLSRTNFSGNV